jgi:hypothetical protein
MRGGEQLGQGRFNFVPKIDINTGGSVSFLSFHAGQIKPVIGRSGEKIHRPAAGSLFLKRGDESDQSTGRRFQSLQQYFGRRACESAPKGGG